MLNNVVLMGRPTADPELKSTQSDIAAPVQDAQPNSDEFVSSPYDDDDMPF